jgi:hypothetical protein
LTEVKLKDISTEEFREYMYPDYTIRIEKPLGLNVSKTGGHRVLDGEGISHYIPSGWRHLRWKANPPFSF